MSGMILSSRAFILSFSASFFFFMRWICSGSQPDCDHGVDRGVEIGVILLELGVFQANFGLFLVRHGYRLQGFGRQKAPIRAGSGSDDHRRGAIITFLPAGKCCLRFNRFLVPNHSTSKS